MNIRLLFSYILFLLLFASCTRKELPSVHLINLENRKDALMTDVFSDLSVIPLKANGNYVSVWSNLIVADNYFILSDNRNIIHVYKKDGTFVSNSERKLGKGTEEYINMISFSFNPYSEYIEVVTHNKIIYYDTSFNFIRNTSVPTKKANKSGNGFVYYDRIYDLSETVHALIPTSISEKANRIIIFDSNKEIILKEIPFDDILADVSMQYQCFMQPSNDSLFFFPPRLSNYSYLFDKTNYSIEKYMLFDLGKNKLTANNIESIGSKDLNNYLLESDKDMPICYFQTQNKIVLIKKQGNKISNWQLVIHDILNKQNYSIDFFKDDEMHMPIVSCSDNNSLYAVVDKENIESIISNFDNKIWCVTDSLEDGDMALLKFTLK